MSEQEFNKIFSQRLKEYMERYSISQVDLAKRLGVSTTTTYNWLNAIKTPRMDKVDMLCEIFHCNRSDLIADLENGHPSYYLDEESAERIKAMQSDPKLATVFDATRKVKPQDLDQVLKLIKTYIGEDS